jgi:hypothetical protein
MKNTIEKPTVKTKRVKIWMYQSNLSGNANGHFSFIELPVNSNKKTLKNAVGYRYYKIYNVHCLGIFESEIGDQNFPSDEFLKKIRSI